MILLLVNWQLFQQDWKINGVVKNTKFNTRKTKKKNLEKKIPVTATLIHENQYNTME